MYKIFDYIIISVKSFIALSTYEQRKSTISVALHINFVVKNIIFISYSTNISLTKAKLPKMPFDFGL